jgi:hypothetical protein
VDDLHVQDVAKDEGDSLLRAEVGEPVAEGPDGLEKSGRAGGGGVVEDSGALGVENADSQGSGVKIDAA